MRVLILSAPVGAGHDAAARGVADALRARGVEVEVDDGLALMGSKVHRLVCQTPRENGPLLYVVGSFSLPPSASITRSCATAM